MAINFLLEQAQDSYFWRSLNSELTISENIISPSCSSIAIEPEHLDKLMFYLKQDGYFQIDPILPTYLSSIYSSSQRLGLLGKQILQYRHMYSLSDELVETGTELKKMLSTFNSNNNSNSAPKKLVMENLSSEVQQKIREQYNTGPYPRVPLEDSPKKNALRLYYHNLLTPYYLKNKQVVYPEGKIILDVGCGTGYTTLTLAEANPGAKIVAVDISEESLDLAQKRLRYHGFDRVEFHLLPLEDLPQLGMKFDYINSDEILYLLPDIVVGLKAMKAVLKPHGIIRSNLHSSLQRENFYRSQSICKMMGLLDENPGEMEVDIVREMFKSLKDGVKLKQSTWDPGMEKDDQKVFMNHLIQGDKGYTIPEMFSAISAANLEFISMVNWRQWDIMELFKEPDNLPTFLAFSLPEASIEDKLHLFELFHPVHRLLDFWCGFPDQTESVTPIEEWTNSDWQKARVHLHPQLNTPEMKEDLFRSIKRIQPFQITKHLANTGQESFIDSNIAACIFPPLLESPQSMEYLVGRWQKLHPVDPLTDEPTTDEEAFYILRQVIIDREASGHILLER